MTTPRSFDDAALALTTRLVAAGRTRTPGAPQNAPLVAASSLIHGAEGSYARTDGTATWRAFEEVVGALEGGDGCAFASGMAAVAAVFELVPRGGRVVLTDDVYQGVAALAGRGHRVDRVPATATDAWLSAAKEADLVWIESPTNPLLELADVSAIASAPRRGLLVVDATLATPLRQRPLALGADVVVHSATKLLGGHSDLLCGIAIARTRTLADALRGERALRGATPGVLEAYLATRGLRTLAVRLDRAEATARELVARLGAHPAVERVRYPGFGVVVSFDVAGGGERADAVCRALRLIVHATSFGGVESTIERRAAHPGQEHLPPGLLRMSVGLEHVDDLDRDLDAALAATCAR